MHTYTAFSMVRPNQRAAGRSDASPGPSGLSLMAEAILCGAHGLQNKRPAAAVRADHPGLSFSWLHAMSENQATQAAAAASSSDTVQAPPATKPVRKAKTSRSPPKPQPAWDSRPAKPRQKTEAEEMAELREMIASPSKEGGGGHHSKDVTDPSQTSQASSGEGGRPRWDKRPLINPPGAVRGLRPVTQEPWVEVQQEDNKTKHSFGHEDEYEYSDGYNFLVDEARRNREENSSGQAWRVTPVRHVPAALRGQKPRRKEPWTASNDDISFLNAIDGVSVNEFYAVTADRDNRVTPTIVQPSWDGSQKLGRPSMRPDLVAERQWRAQHFRAARAPGAPEGGPVHRSPPKAKGKLKAKTERSATADSKPRES